MFDHLVLLDGVAANVTGSWKTVAGFKNFSMQTIHTGTPTGGVVTLEGSNDGDTAAPTALATFTIGSDANGEINYVIDSPVAYIRAKLASLAGGTSPTVSVKVIAS